MYAILESSTKKCFILMVLLKFTFLLRELKNRRRKIKLSWNSCKTVLTVTNGTLHLSIHNIQYLLSAKILRYLPPSQWTTVTSLSRRTSPFLFKTPDRFNWNKKQFTVVSMGTHFFESVFELLLLKCVETPISQSLDKLKPAISTKPLKSQKVFFLFVRTS